MSTTGQKTSRKQRKRKYFKVREEDDSVKELTALMANLSITGQTRPRDWLTDTEDVIMEDPSFQNAPPSKRSRAVDGQSAGKPPEAQRKHPNKLDTHTTVDDNRPDRKRRKFDLETNKAGRSVSLQKTSGCPTLIITVPQDRQRQRGRTGRGQTKCGAHLHRHSENSTVQVEKRTQRGQSRKKRWLMEVTVQPRGTDRLMVAATPASCHAQPQPGVKGTRLKRNSRAQIQELI